MCDIEESLPLEKSIPSDCYVFQYSSGLYGYASEHDVKSLNEMTIEKALLESSWQFNGQIRKDYANLSTRIQSQGKVAMPRPKLVVKMCRKSKGRDETIEVMVVVKRKPNPKEENEETDKDEIMFDSIRDNNELRNIMYAYNNKGFLGILDSFGMTFANLNISLNHLDLLTDIDSIAYQIHKQNLTMNESLREHLCNFLTLFTIQFSNDFEYHKQDGEYLEYLEKQYENARSISDTLSRLTLSDQYKFIRTAPPSLFLPIFKLKEMIESKTQISEMTFHEYFIMTFKQLYIFSNTTQKGVFFKSNEALDSESLKLSLNIMNKKWIENKSRIQPDFVLVRYFHELVHYHLIGEFENTELNASTAEEFLCLHSDTIKIILEGRAVLKDIVTALTMKRVEDNIKRNLLVTMFLADMSGKVVILKMRPILHEIQEALHGIYYELSFSKLLNLFDKKDAFTIMSEISNSVERACNLSYNVDEKSSITNLCPIPMTLQSKSEIEKLVTIHVKEGCFNFEHPFREDDEIRLFDFLSKEYPQVMITKTRVAKFAEIQTIPIQFTMDESRNIIMFAENNTSVCENPIEACYPIYFGAGFSFQIISLYNDSLNEP